VNCPFNSKFFFIYKECLLCDRTRRCQKNWFYMYSHVHWCESRSC
jgi:hypothetical protein